MKRCEHDFGGELSEKPSPDAELWDDEPEKTEADSRTDEMMQQNASGMSQPV